MSNRQNIDRRLDDVAIQIRNLRATVDRVDRANDRLHVNVNQFILAVKELESDVYRRIDHVETQLDRAFDLLDHLYEDNL